MDAYVVEAQKDTRTDLANAAIISTLRPTLRGGENQQVIAKGAVQFNPLELRFFRPVLQHDGIDHGGVEFRVCAIVRHSREDDCAPFTQPLIAFEDSCGKEQEAASDGSDRKSFQS